jgi:hydrogenase-4 membrane subunit HyfE
MAEHRRSYHEWPSSTPVLDIVRAVVAAASVLIAAYAIIFLGFAVRDGSGSDIAAYGLFLVGVLLANAAVEVTRRWRRHHG